MTVSKWGAQQTVKRLKLDLSITKYDIKFTSLCLVAGQASLPTNYSLAMSCNAVTIYQYDLLQEIFKSQAEHTIMAIANSYAVQNA